MTRRLRRLPGAWLALTGVSLLALVVLMHAGRDTTFFFDDWNFVLERGAWRPYTFLAPHNEHFSAVPVLAYKVLLELFGLDSYGVFRFVLALLVVLCGVLIALYARPRVGLWPGVALAACVMLLGQGYFDLIWAFQMGFAGSFAAGIGALLLLDRKTRRSDVAASVLLLVSVASSSMGLPILGGVLIEVLGRPDRRARWWVAVAPLILYAAWYLKYGKSAAQLSNADAIPNWIHQSLSQAAGALTGLGGTYGTVLAVLLVAAVARAFLRDERPPAAPAAPVAPAGPSHGRFSRDDERGAVAVAPADGAGRGTLDWRLIGLCAMALALWTLTPLARADEGVGPAESRYLWPGGIFVALIALQAFRGPVLRGRVVVAVCAVLAFCASSSAVQLETGGDMLRGQSLTARATLSAMEIAGVRTLPYTAIPVEGQVQVLAGRYADALDRYSGSPAYPVSELEGSAPEAIKQVADRKLWSVLGVGVEPFGGRPAGCTASVDGTVRTDLPTTGLVIDPGAASVEIRLRRFAATFQGDPASEVPPTGPHLLTIRPAENDAAWKVELTSAAAFRVCPA